MLAPLDIEVADVPGGVRTGRATVKRELQAPCNGTERRVACVCVPAGQCMVQLSNGVAGVGGKARFDFTPLRLVQWKAVEVSGDRRAGFLGVS